MITFRHKSREIRDAVQMEIRAIGFKVLEPFLSLKSRMIRLLTIDPSRAAESTFILKERNTFLEKSRSRCLFRNCFWLWGRITFAPYSYSCKVAGDLAALWFVFSTAHKRLFRGKYQQMLLSMRSEGTHVFGNPVQRECWFSFLHSFSCFTKVNENKHFIVPSVSMFVLSAFYQIQYIFI